MRRLCIAAVFVILLGLYAVLGRADSYSIGKTVLSGDTIDLDVSSVVATGHASLVTAPSSSPIPAGTMRLESLKAEQISVSLARSQKGSMSTREASATGGVTIKAKRADKDTGPGGKQTTVVRDVTASAKSASLPAGESSVVLTGGATVKVTEPGLPEPLIFVKVEQVIIDLKTAKIRVVGQPGNPAGLTYTPKEESR